MTLNPNKYRERGQEHVTLFGCGVHEHKQSCQDDSTSNITSWGENMINEEMEDGTQLMTIHS